jgi:uncharacterized protein
MQTKKFFIFAGILLSFFSVSRAEPQLPDVPKTYVSDFAGLLNPAQINQIEKQLTDIERAGSSQVLVVTIPDLQDLTIEEYSIGLAEKWKPGHKGRDNGVILLVAPKERKTRIEVGYGLEGVLTDALTRNIIETRITPAFRQGDFFSGIQGGVQSISQAIAGEYEPLPAPGGSGGGGFPLALIIFFIIFLIVLGRAFNRARSYGFGQGSWRATVGGWSRAIQLGRVGPAVLRVGLVRGEPVGVGPPVGKGNLHQKIHALRRRKAGHKH